MTLPDSSSGQLTHTTNPEPSASGHSEKHERHHSHHFSWSGSAKHSVDEVQERAVTDEEVQQVKGSLGTEYMDACDDKTIKRFIRATGHNLPLSIKRLQNTVKWQREVQPGNVVCHSCGKDPRSHYMHIVGFCQLQRPVIYSCLALASNRVYEDNKAHMIQTFETAVKCMPEGVEQWVWVCDFHGFGMADINPKLAKTFLDVSAEHYPERLGLFLVVDAPRLFSVLWNAIKYWVDPKTFKKIRFLPFDADSKHGSKSVLKGELEQHFAPKTVDWFIREMTENRVKAIAKAKVYSIPKLHGQAVAGELLAGENTDLHELRGTTELLAVYNSNPTVLEPQAHCTS